MSIQQIKLNSKQRGFMNDKGRYPAFVASWASGKTMMGLLKGLRLSEAYSDNLGLVVRQKFTDLRDSTVRDFERYTDLEINKSTKEIILPNKSTIMFRHGEELSGLQNVNLGWFMIEQGEEFDTAEQFDLLRGRLRRSGVGLRQGIVIANTCGHNWIWDRWKNRILDGYSLHESTTFDNSANLPKDFLADLERMKIESPKKYNRYVLNSWEDYDLEGAYYAALMSDLLVAGRITQLDYHPDSPVHTFWDIGDIYTAIWFVQFADDQAYLVDYYYDCEGKGLLHYAKVVREKPYKIGRHFAPFDIRGSNAKSFQTGRATLDVALEEGIDFEIVEAHRVEDRIESARRLIPHCWFDVSKCKDGIDALNHYKKKKNETLSTENRTVYGDSPQHDWSSHGADAFGYMAMAVRYNDVVLGKVGRAQIRTGAEVHLQRVNVISTVNAVDDFSDMYEEEENVCYTR